MRLQMMKLDEHDRAVVDEEAESEARLVSLIGVLLAFGAFFIMSSL